MLMFDLRGRARCGFGMVRVTALAIAAMFGVGFGSSAEAQSLSHIQRYAAIVVDSDSGEVLYSRNADSARHPASITKVMTLYMLFKALDDDELKLTDRIYFSYNAASQAPSKLGVVRGGWITVEEAIRALTTKSANDVAVAVAERLAGSELMFARTMTEQAQKLGMKSSAFYNASGLPNADHTTTARDLATLSRAIIHDFPHYYAFFSQQAFNFNGRVLPNHNKLLGRMVGLDGIKTGYTAASGYTLAASAVRSGKRLIAVVLGAPTGTSRNANIEALLENGFEVLNRRKRGDRVAIADLMYERPALLDVRTAIVEQGSADDVSIWRSAIRNDAAPAAAGHSGRKSGTDK